MADDVEQRTLRKVAWRFIPFLIVCYFVAFLDRVNVGFAKLTMDADLKLSETAFGFGAGVLSLGYFLFEASNIILVTTACAAVAFIITVALGHDPHLERAPEAAE